MRILSIALVPAMIFATFPALSAPLGSYDMSTDTVVASPALDPAIHDTTISSAAAQ